MPFAVLFPMHSRCARRDVLSSYSPTARRMNAANKLEIYVAFHRIALFDCGVFVCFAQRNNWKSHAKNRIINLLYTYIFCRFEGFDCYVCSFNLFFFSNVFTIWFIFMWIPIRYKFRREIPIQLSTYDKSREWNRSQPFKLNDIF